MKKAIGIIILLLVCCIFLIPTFVEYGFLITVSVVVITTLFFLLIRLAIDLITE
jgi:hypothetical protein